VEFFVVNSKIIQIDNTCQTVNLVGDMQLLICFAGHHVICPCCSGVAGSSDSHSVSWWHSSYTTSE